jgi:hypothetical protein
MKETMQASIRSYLAGWLLCTLAAMAPAFGEETNESREFVDLFNGKDLSGWVVEGTKEHGREGKRMPVWTAADGMIVCDGAGFGFLRCDREVRDFVLKLEFRLQRGVNSGIGIRHGKFTGERRSRPSFHGYEIQLLDDADKKPTKSSTGSLYRYVAPRAQAVKPSGEWNQLTIECRGPQIAVTLNDKLLHDVDQRTVPEISDKPLSGYFSLQNHGGDVAFRNIRLKELE